jgi:hypothetical protein
VVKFGNRFVEKDHQREERNDGDSIVHPSPAQHFANDVIGHIPIAQSRGPFADRHDAFQLNEKALSRFSGSARFLNPGWSIRPIS